MTIGVIKTRFRHEFDRVIKVYGGDVLNLTSSTPESLSNIKLNFRLVHKQNW